MCLLKVCRPFIVYLLLSVISVPSVYASIDNPGYQSILSSGKKDTALVNALIDFAWEQNDLDFSQMELAGRKALELSIRHDFPTGKMKAFMVLGRIKIKNLDYDSAKFFFQSALDDAIITNSWDMEGWAHKSLGILYYKQCLYEMSMLHYTKALYINRSHQYTKGIISALINMGNLQELLRNYQRSNEIFKEILGIPEIETFPDKKAKALNGVGITYWAMDSLDLAMKYLQEVEIIYLAIKNPKGLANAWHGKGIILWKSGAYTEAKQFLRKALLTNDSINNFQGALFNHLYLGNIAVQEQRFDTAKMHFEVLESAVNNSNFEGLKLDLLEDLAEYYLKTGQPYTAINYTKQYGQLQDSLHNLGRKALAEELYIKYQTLEKEEQLKKERMQKNQLWFGLITACLALFGILIFWLYKKFKQSERKRKEEEKEYVITLKQHEDNNQLLKNMQEISRESNLSQRELDVLELVALGYTNKEIASKLNIAVKTVDNHRTNILKKSDCKNAADLTRYAFRIGLIQNEVA